MNSAHADLIASIRPLIVRTNPTGTRAIVNASSPTGMVHAGILDLTGARREAGGSMWIGTSCAPVSKPGLHQGGMAGVRYLDPTAAPVTCKLCRAKVAK